MYDSEEEVKRKRKRLISIIGIVVLLIVLLLIFLIVRSLMSKKSDNDISCVLEVMNGDKPNSSGIYNKEIEIGFKDISTSKEYEIVKKAIGTTDSSNNSETYKITNSGNYKLYGFVEDSKGNKAECELKVVVSMTVPTCELEVKNGTLGLNNWYNSDVEVGFKSMETNNNTLNIAKYYITNNVENVPNKNNEKLVISNDGASNVTGVIIDSAGGVGNCSIKVNKDTTKPSCSLKVSGTKNSNNEYTDNPVISFESTNDEISKITEMGIGTSKNYTNSTFTISNSGKTVVYGYVKDEAGNEGTCSLEVNKAEPEQPTPTPTPTPKPEKKNSSPKCVFNVAFTEGSYSNNIVNSKSDVFVDIIPSTTNGAVITEYSISIDNGPYDKNLTRNSTTLDTTDGAQVFTYVKEFKNNGTHYVTGFVKDSYGNTGYCPSANSKKSTLIININK